MVYWSLLLKRTKNDLYHIYITRNDSYWLISGESGCGHPMEASQPMDFEGARAPRSICLSQIVGIACWNISSPSFGKWQDTSGKETPSATRYANGRLPTSTLRLGRVDPRGSQGMKEVAFWVRRLHNDNDLGPRGGTCVKGHACIYDHLCSSIHLSSSTCTSDQVPTQEFPNHPKGTVCSGGNL